MLLYVCQKYTHQKIYKRPLAKLSQFDTIKMQTVLGKFGRFTNAAPLESRPIEVVLGYLQHGD